MKTFSTSLLLALVLSSSLVGFGCGSDKKSVTVVDAASDHVATDGLPGQQDVTPATTDAVVENDALGSETGSADALVQEDTSVAPKDAPASSDVSAASDAKVD